MRRGLVAALAMVYGSGCRLGYEPGAVESGAGGERVSAGNGAGGVSEGGTSDVSHGGAASVAGANGAGRSSSGGMLAGGSAGMSNAGGALAGAAGMGACVEQALTADGTLGGPVAAPCVAGGLLCADMESAPPMETEVAMDGAATLSSTDCERHSGKLSTALKIPPGASYAIVRHTLSNPIALGAQVYGRFWMLIPAGPLPGWAVPFELGTPNGKLSVDVYADGFGVTAVIGKKRSGSSVVTPVPRDVWMCVTFGLAVANSAKVTLDIDGKNQITGTLDTWDQPYTEAFYGLWVEPSANQVSAYVDDLVLADQPVTCN